VLKQQGVANTTKGINILLVVSTLDITGTTGVETTRHNVGYAS
jgi:hypothetical protein